jgi:hypothetical protein
MTPQLVKERPKPSSQKLNWLSRTAFSAALTYDAAFRRVWVASQEPHDTRQRLQYALYGLSDVPG